MVWQVRSNRLRDHCGGVVVKEAPHKSSIENYRLVWWTGPIRSPNGNLANVLLRFVWRLYHFAFVCRSSACLYLSIYHIIPFLVFGSTTIWTLDVSFNDYMPIINCQSNLYISIWILLGHGWTDFLVLNLMAYYYDALCGHLDKYALILDNDGRFVAEKKYHVLTHTLL